MPVSNYKVHKEWIEEAEFEILVLELPAEDLEDKLAYLARDKGNITRSFYEDFVIATCVGNINQLIHHVRQQSANPRDLMKVREQTMGIVFNINPLLHPDNLIINRNSVVKLKDKDGPNEGERLLTDTKNWDTSYYDEVMEQHGVDPKKAGEDNTPTAFKGKSHPTSNNVKALDDLSYEVTKKWWKRINQYVNIKRYDEDDMESILKQRYFHNRSSFQTFIVSVCVVESEDLFTMLDNMGIPARVAPPILMHEVYKLCEEVNPFLTYENAKEFVVDEDDADDETPNKKMPPNRMASHARAARAKKKKPKKTFKSVPKEDLLKLGDNMKVFLIGQDQAVDQLVEAIQRASVGLKDPVKPIGSFLFAGRTGIGKTLATKVLADELIKEKDNLVTIDCSEYTADHEYAKLIGAPSGYVGHEQGGVLTNAIRENPFSVVVFDEIEKASHRVSELLLQVLEEGRLTDGKGQQVSFKDTVIVLTSNIGVKEVDDVKSTIGFGDVATLTEDKKVKAIDKALKAKFKPEFLNRLDSVVHFKNLAKTDYMRIIDIELYKLNDNLKNNDTEYRDVTIHFDDKIRNFIYKEGINEDFGARPLKRCIEKEISTPLAKLLLETPISSNTKVSVTLKRGKIAIDVTEEPEEELATAAAGAAE
jgi:hypothetical protein